MATLQAPIPDNLIASKPLTSAVIGNWLEIDITCSVRAYLDNPASQYSAIYLKLDSSLTKSSLTIDSKENPASGHPAWIDLELMAGPRGPVGPPWTGFAICAQR